MAASMDWRKLLRQHKLFEDLRENRDNLNVGNESKKWIVVKDSEIYVWNPYDSCILATNLKYIENESEKEVRATGSRSASGVTRPPYQRLTLTSPPVFAVDSLLFSVTGAYLALVGKKGLSVIQLPQRRGRYGMYEGGKERILCKTIPVAERLFIGSSCKLLHAAWHPGSPDTHITLLTSDNNMRTYALDDPREALHNIFLTSCASDQASFRSSALSILSLQRVLGDAAVSFDFGPPIDLAPKRKSKGRALDRDETAERGWPAFVLWGNGEVFQVIIPLDSKSYPVPGPMPMYPPAEDNYGTDACSLLCLASQPPVLVVSTEEGRLYHCVVLDYDREDASEVVSQFDASSTEDGWSADWPPTRSLHVYESIELELALTTAPLHPDQPEADEMEDFTCPVWLHKDVGEVDRYHCSHSAGVHSVVLPWITKIQHFCQADNSQTLPQMGPDSQSVVEHLICTKPLPSSPPSPVLGIGTIQDRRLGDPTLLCLTSTVECVILPLLKFRPTVAPPLLSTLPAKPITSPLKLLHRDPFDQYIKRILLRSSSNPLLKTDASHDLGPQECFQLLTRATQVFREEYIQKQDLAREEIERRVRVLREQKRQQKEDLNQCMHAKNILTDKTRDLAEKYEDAKDRQQQIVSRTETMLKKIQSRLPSSSDAEKNMHRELRDIEEKLKYFQATIKQLKVKQEYQERQVKQQKSKSQRKTHFSKNQMEQLRNVLKEEGDDIADLVKQVNQVRVTMDT